MNETAFRPQFSEAEKQMLTRRLQTAARTVRRPVRAGVRRLVCAAAAAALLVIGADALPGAFTGLKLHIGGQQIAASAVLTLHTDGSATVTVCSPGADDTHITDYSGALSAAILTGDQQAAAAAAAPIVQDRDPAAEPYTVYAENDRLLLHINGYIPIDVTEQLASGVSFTYTGADGSRQRATLSGTVENYTVQ
ncbi:MAG: hypothetical protein ACOYIE_09735 [Agathobaculum sp.]|jgi:hypothetical protein|uniref:hypothetical protein n=1 Tax=Agathobaculum sp. TaxID=2048138 RepID=UPI003D8A63E6